MKKYSSYANLKIAPTPKSYPTDYWPAKITTTTPMTRKGSQIPLMMISKEPYAVPITTKYSAGYIQRQKLFSSKKQNKDVTNVNTTGNGKIQTNGCNINILHCDTKIVINKPNSSKSKKFVQEKQRSSKKQSKQIRMPKCLDLQNKQNLYSKVLRYQVQSPKGVPTKLKEQKQRSKPKIQQKQKTQKSNNVSYSKQKQKKQRQKQKQEEQLKQYVTKYQPQPKSILMHCTSDSNLVKTINLQQKRYVKGYYKSAIFNAFFSAKPSSFNQICKNHLTTSIQFLSYVRKNKQMVPTTVSKLNLAPTNRKTLVFDLDQTLIHCNESLDMPHDVALEITFPNNSKIKAGINIRPYAVQCLKQLSRYFQIIVFTASHQCYANVIIDHLDPKRQFISYRYFRQTCHKTQQGFYVKDLRVFSQSRDLSNLLLIDNAAYSYSFQPQNGVPIIPFYNNKADLQLKEITLYLKQFITTRDMRNKNQNYMRLSEYHRYSCPKQLLNQLYF